MSKNYKQYDTRWAKLGYPKKPWYIKDCGCGEVAIANSIDKCEKYKNETPKTILPYCRQFAAPNGDGTYWDAPPTMMKHYGMMEVKEHQTMKPLWKELAKGGRVAIYLMSNRIAGSNGIKWTGSKHFICSVAYRYNKKTGKHEVFIKDSNSDSKAKNGWHAYEDVLRNAVFKVWSGKLPAEAKKSATPEWVKKANAWARKIAADDSWHYVTWSSNAKTHECPICHDHPKGKFHGWNCIGFSFAYWHHGGGLKCNCNCGVIDNSFMTKLLTMNADEALKQLRKKIGLKDLQLIRNNKKNIPQSKMKAGDLCLVYDKNNKCIHIYPYIGNGYMIDCGGWSDTSKQIAKRKASACKVIIRYTGK